MEGPGKPRGGAEEGDKKAPAISAGAYGYGYQQGLILVAVHVLYVNSVLHRLALGDRRLGEILAAAEFLQDARALVFTFELLQGALDVFALFYRHDNHSSILFFVFFNFVVYLNSSGVRIT